jgi:hypothetical protein
MDFVKTSWPLLKVSSPSVQTLFFFVGTVGHGYLLSVYVFRLENDMDGYALSLAFAAHSGPDCLKDVVQKYGLRLKVYQAIKAELEAERYQVIYTCVCMHTCLYTVVVIL